MTKVKIPTPQLSAAPSPKWNAGAIAGAVLTAATEIVAYQASLPKWLLPIVPVAAALLAFYAKVDNVIHELDEGSEGETGKFTGK